MRTVYFLVWLLLTALLSWLAYSTKCNTGKAEAVSTITGANYFNLKGDGLNVDCEYNAFTKSNYRLINSMKSNSDCYIRVANYLKNKPNEALFIDGFYAENETNNSIYDNLGQARASQIKKALMSTFGIPASQIKTGAQLVSDTAFALDTLKDGYRFRLGKLQRADLSNFDIDRAITLNFNTGSSVPILNSEIRNDFSQFINYLEANPTATMQVTGHTDTQGEATQNMILGQQRADEIKDYLVRNGIQTSQITTNSRGEEQPISSIDSENRRVTINILNNN